MSRTCVSPLAAVVPIAALAACPAAEANVSLSVAPVRARAGNQVRATANGLSFGQSCRLKDRAGSRTFRGAQDGGCSSRPARCAHSSMPSSRNAPIASRTRSCGRPRAGSPRASSIAA